MDTLIHPSPARAVLEGYGPEALVTLADAYLSASMVDKMAPQCRRHYESIALRLVGACELELKHFEDDSDMRGVFLHCEEIRETVEKNRDDRRKERQ